MQTTSNLSRDTGGILCAVALICVGIIALYDTTFMVDSDSYVFPRAIAGAMIGFASLDILKEMFWPSGVEHPALDKKSIRSVLLVTTMLVSVLLIPSIGFLLAGMLTFGGLMILSMYDPWTVKRRITFPIGGVAVVYGLYMVFNKVFLVQFPEATIF